MNVKLLTGGIVGGGFYIQPTIFRERTKCEFFRKKASGRLSVRTLKDADFEDY